MNDHGITKENLLFAFPVGLRENEEISALGNVAAEALAERPDEIALLALYPRIDELPEELLDILAYDFKVDWWDQNYSLEEKRRTLKSSWKVHKMMGTKAAVETAISAIYPATRVMEWFEYGGQPYHFRLDIDPGGDVDAEKQRRVLARLNFYKNLRSHLDSIDYRINTEVETFTGAELLNIVKSLWVDVRVPGEVGPPRPKVEASRGIQPVSVIDSVLVGIQIPGNVGPPRSSETIGALALREIVDWDVAVQVELPPDVGPPKVLTGKSVDVEALSIQQEIYTEVRVNGME